MKQLVFAEFEGAACAPDGVCLRVQYPLVAGAAGERHSSGFRVNMRRAGPAPAASRAKRVVPGFVFRIIALAEKIRPWFQRFFLVLAVGLFGYFLPAFHI